jgi:hypothetical protein
MERYRKPLRDYSHDLGHIARPASKGFLATSSAHRLQFTDSSRADFTLPDSGL